MQKGGPKAQEEEERREIEEMRASETLTGWTEVVAGAATPQSVGKEEESRGR